MGRDCLHLILSGEEFQALMIEYANGYNIN